MVLLFFPQEKKVRIEAAQELKWLALLVSVVLIPLMLINMVSFASFSDLFSGAVLILFVAYNTFLIYMEGTEITKLGPKRWKLHLAKWIGLAFSTQEVPEKLQKIVFKPLWGNGKNQLYKPEFVFETKKLSVGVFTRINRPELGLSDTRSLYKEEAQKIGEFFGIPIEFASKI